jgi:hypothetical protein
LFFAPKSIHRFDAGCATGTLIIHFITSSNVSLTTSKYSTMSSLTPPNQLLDDDILEEAGFRLQDGQATERMAKSIHKLAQLLVCPLCNKVNVGA